ncbi:hypothetical protein JXA34_00380 [Patescibacteria group bacterium]|nr:hypothetical protein [Patescibacteria group bacterium]
MCGCEGNELNKHTLEKAKEQEDPNICYDMISWQCEDIDTLGVDRDYAIESCLKSLAVQTKNPALCSSLISKTPFLDTKAECLTKVANASGNFDICYKIDNAKMEVIQIITKVSNTHTLPQFLVVYPR